MLTWTDPDAHCPTCGIFVPELERLRAENEAIKEQLEEFLCLAHAVAGEGVLGDQRQVLANLHELARRLAQSPSIDRDDLAEEISESPNRCSQPRSSLTTTTTGLPGLDHLDRAP